MRRPLALFAVSASLLLFSPGAVAMTEKEYNRLAAQLTAENEDIAEQIERNEEKIERYRKEGDPLVEEFTSPRMAIFRFSEDDARREELMDQMKRLDEKIAALRQENQDLLWRSAANGRAMIDAKDALERTVKEEQRVAAEKRRLAEEQRRAEAAARDAWWWNVKATLVGGGVAGLGGISALLLSPWGRRWREERRAWREEAMARAAYGGVAVSPALRPWGEFARAGYWMTRTALMLFLFSLVYTTTGEVWRGLLQALPAVVREPIAAGANWFADQVRKPENGGGEEENG